MFANRVYMGAGAVQNEQNNYMSQSLQLTQQDEKTSLSPAPWVHQSIVSVDNGVQAYAAGIYQDGTPEEQQHELALFLSEASSLQRGLRVFIDMNGEPDLPAGVPPDYHDICYQCSRKTVDQWGVVLEYFESIATDVRLVTQLYRSLKGRESMMPIHMLSPKSQNLWNQYSLFSLHDLDGIQCVLDSICCDIRIAMDIKRSVTATQPLPIHEAEARNHWYSTNQAKVEQVIRELEIAHDIMTVAWADATANSDILDNDGIE